MPTILSGDVAAGIRPIATARTQVRDSSYIALTLSETDRREVVREFVRALTGFAATGHLVMIRHGNILESADALTEVANNRAVVEALTLLLSPADADDLAASLDELADVRELEATEAIA